MAKLPEGTTTMSVYMSVEDYQKVLKAAGDVSLSKYVKKLILKVLAGELIDPKGLATKEDLKTIIQQTAEKFLAPERLRKQTILEAYQMFDADLRQQFPDLYQQLLQASKGIRSRPRQTGAA